jgi:NitT/TauT family transport system ATP-binding protein
MIRWGQTGFSEAGARAAAAAYRPDLYRAALPSAAMPLDDDLRIEGVAEHDRFMDGFIFDPAQLKAYAEAFPVRSRLAQDRGEEDV